MRRYPNHYRGEKELTITHNHAQGMINRVLKCGIAIGALIGMAIVIVAYS